MSYLVLAGILALNLCGGGVFALYDSSDEVVELTDAIFERRVVQDDAIWVVEFFAPWCGHCQQLAPEYKKAAKALKGVIKVGAVDCDNEKAVCGKYGVRGFPTIKIFGAKSTPTDYNGARTAQGIADAAIAEAKAKVKVQLNGGGKSSGGGGSSSGKDDVIELTDSNFDKTVLESDDVWLVEFFAPWCGHCKNLAPHWAKAASELKGKVKLGALDAEAHKAKAAQYGVKGYPTIKFFPAGRKDVHSAQDYDGGRTSSDIVAWALDKYSASVPPPELVEIISPDAITDCQAKPLCVVSFLPHILDCDAKCRNGYLDLLRRMGEKYKQKLWGWYWAEAQAQGKLEEYLDIGGFGYPAMAVLNPKKGVYSVLRGAYSDDGISSFLRDISFGRGQTSLVKSQDPPKVYKNDPWDGKDGQPPVEEDIDLSDVVLDEKDEL